LLERALFETESTCRILDEDFDLIKSTWPIIQEVTMERMGPKQQIEDVVQSLRKYQKLFKYLPGRIDKILNKIETGELTVKMDVRGATHLETKLGELFKRIEFGLIISFLMMITTWVYVSGKELNTGTFLFFLFLILLTWLLGNFFWNIYKKT
jgi:ubiquinone biosynthesis protein